MDMMEIFAKMFASEHKKLGPIVGPLTAEELAEKQIIDSRRDALDSRVSELKLDMEANEVERKMWWRKVEKSRGLLDHNIDLRISDGSLYRLIDKEPAECEHGDNE